MKDFLKAAAILVLFLVVPAGLITAANIIASRMEKNVREEWNRRLEPIEAFKARFARLTKNASAARLETLAIPLGLNVRPSAEGTAAVDDRAPQSVEMAKLREPLANYINKEIERESGAADDPPAGVAKFVNAHIDPLLAIENHINHADLPAWTFDSEHVFRTPLPNLLGYIKLARLMSAHAVIAQKSGRAAEAWDAMHAVSRLAQSMDNQPLLTPQLISVAISKYEAAFVRKLQAPAPAWQDEFSHRDFQRPFLDSFVGEQLHITESFLQTKEVGSNASAGIVWLYRRILLRPYLRMCAADAWRAQTELLEKLKDKNICDLDAIPIESEIPIRLAGWNHLGFLIDRNYASSLVRLRMLIIGHELTAKVLQAKGARSASGAWPVAIAGIEKSRCSGRSWNYGVAADGTMTLVLDKPIATPKKQGSLTLLPLSYSEK
jgi:hypothetical protein